MLPDPVVLIIEFTDIAAVKFIQHGDVTAVAVAPPALFAVDKDRVVTIIMLAEMLGRLTVYVNCPLTAFPANEVRVIPGELGVLLRGPTNCTKCRLLI